jgi:hypothetical protein
MKGGAFSPDEMQNLKGQGLNDYQIESLNQLGITYAEVMQKFSSIMNRSSEGFNSNSDDMAEQVVTELLNEHTTNNPNATAMNLEPIPNADDDDHHMDMDNDDLNLSQHSNGSLHLSDLDQMSTDSGYTTDESRGWWGGKRRRNRKSRKHIKNRKGLKSRKHKGGSFFGTGVGSNSNDPNFSVYNTNMLKLFPYRA